ncbi:MAG: hypothetical protein RIQ46_447 [Pseudomonadota bacterium]
MYQDPKGFDARLHLIEGAQRERGEVLGLARIEAAKRAFTTRRITFQASMRLLRAARPAAGDLVLARIETLGQHQKLESPHGRRAQLYEGDEIIVAFGERYAPDQFEAVVPADLGPCDLVAGGGVAGAVLSRHARMKRATRIQPIGLIADALGRPVNLAGHALPDRPLSGQFRRGQRPQVIAVAGTSMNAGKTTTAAGLIHGMARAGLKVAATKVTGTGSGGDVWSMVDAGACRVLDFTDMGHASTAGLPLDRIERTALSLIAHCAGEAPDAIVVEIADGVLQRETAHLLSCEAFRAAIDGVLFAAGDALGAVGGREWLLAHGHRVIGVSGLVSASPLAAREASRAMGEAVLTLSQLRDPVAAPQICFAADPAIALA